MLEISLRTYKRWTDDGEIKTDGRPDAERPEPANKLKPEERQRILDTCNEKEYQNLPPSQIVLSLSDKGTYIASESTIYRVLNEADQVHRRGKTQAPRRVSKPETYVAAGPNQIWSWEIRENVTADQASLLIRKACLSEGIRERGFALHSDIGSPMKGATMLATLQKLGVVASFQSPIGEQR